jgi:hypothetical protein
VVGLVDEGAGNRLCTVVNARGRVAGRVEPAVEPAGDPAAGPAAGRVAP